MLPPPHALSPLPPSHHPSLHAPKARHGNKLRAMGVDGSLASVRHARHMARAQAHDATHRGGATFCHGDVRTLEGVPDSSFDAAFSAGTLATLATAEEVCAAARALGRVLRPGGRALIASVPKETCAATQATELEAATVCGARCNRMR